MFVLGKGDFKLNRVDCTVMFDVGNTANALSWIRQAEMSATLLIVGVVRSLKDLRYTLVNRRAVAQ